MENEENRGLINKKVYEDQLVTFCQFNFGALSLFSLSLSHSWIQIFLGALGTGSRKAKEGKKKEEASKDEQDQATTTRFFVGIDLHV